MMVIVEDLLLPLEDANCQFMKLKCDVGGVAIAM
jgi:hypothetical protein